MVGLKQMGGHMTILSKSGRSRWREVDRPDSSRSLSDSLKIYFHVAGPCTFRHLNDRLSKDRPL